MNIFVLDRDIDRCAQYHCDAHVSKMILESVRGDAVSAYRAFYLAEKQRFARWTRRAPPPWWTRRAA